MKEFLTLTTQAVLSSTDPQLFEGDDDHKLPLHSQQLVLHGYFRMVGEVMAHAIIHGQVWIIGLAKPVKEFLSTGCAKRASQLACLEDVADLNVREVLKYYFQNESECFIGVSKHRETNAFIVSRCLDTPMKHELEFWK